MLRTASDAPPHAHSLVLAGSGGEAAVWSASTDSGQMVAIKVYHDADPESNLKELLLCVKMNHPNLLRCHAFHLDARGFSLVMELCVPLCRRVLRGAIDIHSPSARQRQ